MTARACAALRRDGTVAARLNAVFLLADWMQTAMLQVSWGCEDLGGDSSEIDEARLISLKRWLLHIHEQSNNTLACLWRHGEFEPRSWALLSLARSCTTCRNSSALLGPSPPSVPRGTCDFFVVA